VPGRTALTTPMFAKGFRSGEPSGIDIGYCLSVAAASRAGLSAFPDRHGPAATVTIPVTQTRPQAIMVTIKSIMVTIANAIAATFTDADTVGPDGYFGLG
jgi:hypothetical protein